MHLGDGWTVALSALTWFVTSFVVGRWAAGWPAERLARAGPFTRLRAWEHSGNWWQRRFRVLRWKDRLPEAGALFEGGRSKRHIGSRASVDLDIFRLETIRAERVHWLIMASTPVHLIWCRATIAVGMVVFGLAFNVPFIIIQRYNRGRIDRVLARRSRTGR
ncbi:MAG: hypothetical protein ABIP03_12000 [Aquihabitans sp.]